MHITGAAMIELYQFPPMWGLPNFSPLCLKLETWLRMAKLPYQAPKCGIPLGKAPKHKLPYIVDRGQSIGDSSLIIDYLKATYGDTRWTMACRRSNRLYRWLFSA